MRPPVNPISMAVVTLSLLPCQDVAAADEGLRTWTDASGKYSVKARFIREQNGLVTLKKETGQQFEIELNKLSAVDQKIVSDLKVADSGVPLKADDAKSAPAGKIDWSKVPAISLTAAASEWKVAPPAPAAPLFASPPKGVKSVARSHFFEQWTALIVSPTANKAAAGRMQQEPGSDKAISRVVIWDLATGKASAPAGLAGAMIPMALADDGQHIVMRRNEFFFKDRLEIWMPRGGSFAKTFEWIPYDDAEGEARDVRWAEFIDANTLTTVSGGGRVVLWSFPGANPVCTFQLGGGCVPALSADRKFIGWCTSKQLGVFNIASRQMIAVQPTPRDLQWPRVAFSPSGKRLACGAFANVLTWDLATGKLEQDTRVGEPGVHDRIEFTHDDFLLLGASRRVTLMELPHQLSLWSYFGPEQVCTQGGWTFMAVSNQDKADALFAVQLPNADATRALKQAVQQPDLLIFRRGTNVRVDTAGVANPEDQEKIRQSLIAKLRDMGCAASDQGTIELVAVVEKNDRSQGQGKYHEFRSTLRLVYQGKIVWETKSGAFTSVATTTDAGYRWWESGTKPIDFFAQVKFPISLPKPLETKDGSSPGTLGRSQVTTEGIR